MSRRYSGKNWKAASARRAPTESLCPGIARLPLRELLPGMVHVLGVTVEDADRAAAIAAVHRQGALGFDRARFVLGRQRAQGGHKRFSLGPRARKAERMLAIALPVQPDAFAGIGPRGGQPQRGVGAFAG